MALKEKEILQVNVRKDENSASRTYGMYFGEVEYKGLLSTRALAEHIADHGSVWTIDIVEGILKQLQVCIPEKVCQGYGVELQGIGIFYPSAKGVKGGFEDPCAQNVNEVCDGIRIRFTPDQSKLDNKCSTKFKEQCALAMNDCVRTIYKTVDGQKVKDQTIHMNYNDWRLQGCPDLTAGSSSSEPVEP